VHVTYCGCSTYGSNGRLRIDNEGGRDLVRKAPALARRATLTGWLHTSARLLAAKTARTEHRRRDREEGSMGEPNSSVDPKGNKVILSLRVPLQRPGKPSVTVLGRIGDGGVIHSLS